MYFNTFSGHDCSVFNPHLRGSQCIASAQVSVKYTNHQQPKKEKALSEQQTMAYKAEIKQQSRNSAKNLYNNSNLNNELTFYCCLGRWQRRFFSLALLKLCKGFAACIWKVDTRTHTLTVIHSHTHIVSYTHVLQLLANFPHNKIIHTFYAQSLRGILSACAREAL